jgi:capsular exopolysaccharide synthesis family protein
MSQRQGRADLQYVRGGREAGRISDEIVAVHDPMDMASEAYRMLRTNLFYALIDNPPEIIVVTSADPREGKSTTCANLGTVLAHAGKNVLLLDCDLRNPMQHKLFGIESRLGLLDVISGARQLSAVWNEPVPGLKVVPAGHTPPNPSEVLSSRRFSEFLVRVRQEFDYVLLDAPPVRLVSDSAILAKNGDGVLLVLDAQETSKRALRQAMHVLDGVGANVIGTVMNKARLPKEDNMYGYVSGYHGDA